MSETHAPQPETKTIYRHEVPIDDKPHTFQLTCNPHAIAAKRIGVAHPRVTHRVEFWAEHNGPWECDRTFQVFGTGQPIPVAARLIGTTGRMDGRVWHLYEVFSDGEGV